MLAANDPAVAAPGTVPVSATAQQIRTISDALFGVANSAVKQYWELKAFNQANSGRPVNVPAPVASGLGLRQVGIGLGVLAVGGLVVWMLLKNKGGRSTRRKR